MVTETQIIDRLKMLVVGVDAAARVHTRWRYPKQNRLAEYSRLFREGGLPGNKVNGYMMRIHRTPLMKGIPGRLSQVTYDVTIRHYASLIESDDDSAASEVTVRTTTALLAAAVEGDVSLGLGKTVCHTGLMVPNDMADVVLGNDVACHRIDYQLQVTVANVNC